LQVQVDDSPLRISEGYLQKIVEELLDNAFKFSPSGSPVSVYGEVQSGRQQYLLRISDRGRGMGPEQVAALSGRLQPGISTSNRPWQGIGLEIVKRLAELHLGNFNIQSQAGQWTTVEVTVPLSD
jgi:two-component system, sensor histidine kinase and response regulator